jgi:PAS domain S-box-containing protein
MQRLGLFDRGEQTGFPAMAPDPKQTDATHLPPIHEIQAFLELLPDPVVILDLTQTVLYINTAFERVFGWSLDRLRGRSLPFVPDNAREATEAKLAQALEGNVVHGFKTRRLTKSGQRLDVIMGVAAVHDPAGRPGGLIVTLSDVTQTRRIARSRRILLRISRALHRYRRLDRMLGYITHLIQALMRVGGASVILLDDAQKEFYYYVTAFDDKAAGQKYETIRFPVDQGVPGEVYRTGRPLIVPNYAKSKYAIKAVDELVQFKTENLLNVPLRLQDRMIGVLGAVNKKEGPFDTEDIELLTAIADVVAAPIENARMTEILKDSYRRVNELNQTKDRVIAHLSHELKTPLAVLSASLKLMQQPSAADRGDQWRRAFERAKRSLQRLLDMEYAIEDILRRGDDASFGMMAQLPQVESAPTEDAAENETKFFQEVNIEFLIHELKDPLSVIETNAQLLLNNKGAAQQRENRRRRSLQRIVRSTQKARELLAALLEVGRADSVCFNCQAFQADEVVRRSLIEVVESHAVDLYERIKSAGGIADQLNALAGDGIRLEVHPSAAQHPVALDQLKFQQIVANLFKNAITYRRRLVLIQLACKHDAVTLAVRDDGSGIAPEHHEKIFERYKQVNPWPGVARHGHGLGLAVARILARAMGGDITLESQLGHGALFRLTLPLLLQQDDESEDPE